MDCIEGIEIGLEEYERVRSNPRRFVVAPSNDHVLPDVEHVVERYGTYFVVEKIGAGADVAESTAPRAGR